MGNDKAIGKILQRVREDAGLEQTDVAEIVGKTRVTISRWENGATIPRDVGRRLIQLYRDKGAKIPQFIEHTFDVAYDTPASVSHETSADLDEESWSPNPALKNKIPQRAYEVALAYCTRLQRGGWPKDEIEQIERLMVDPRYAQANKRKGHELSVDDHIMLIDATWEAVKHTAAALGRQV